MSYVEVRRDGAILWVGLNRPDKRNALNPEMAEELSQVLTEASLEPSVLIVHSTNPGMFVAGADLAELRDRTSETAMLGINAKLFERLDSHRWPTIALIDGPAMGGGCELALACDFRLASDKAIFAQPELSFGIIAGAGANWRLVQTVGIATARRMLYAGFQLDASRALAVGLVDEVVDDLIASGADFARTIALRSWRALELTKLALRVHRNPTTNFDLISQALLCEGTEKVERITAFLDRRAPEAGKRQE